MNEKIEYQEKREHGDYRVENQGVIWSIQFKGKSSKKFEHLTFIREPAKYDERSDRMWNDVLNDILKIIDYHTKTGYARSCSIGPQINPKAEWLKK